MNYTRGFSLIPNGEGWSESVSGAECRARTTPRVSRAGGKTAPKLHSEHSHYWKTKLQGHSVQICRIPACMMTSCSQLWDTVWLPEGRGLLHLRSQMLAGNRTINPAISATETQHARLENRELNSKQFYSCIVHGWGGCVAQSPQTEKLVVWFPLVPSSMQLFKQQCPQWLQ